MLSISLRNSALRSVGFPSYTLAAQSSLLGMFPSAGFAKFDRAKPHLNVGTVGRYIPKALDGAFGFYLPLT